MPTLTKNKKILLASLSVILVLAVVFVATASNAKAGFWEAISNPGLLVTSLLAWVAYGILWLFSKLVALSGFFLESVFQIETFTKVPIVTAGWQVTRGLCNIIFAIILLAMAFDTILQTSKFPIRTVLPRLIIVALLINFSLVFCGIIIDFSQILTNFFIDAAGGTTNSISTQLVNGLNMTQVFKTPTDTTNEADLRAQFGGTSGSLLTIFGSLVLSIIIVLIAAFALAAGAIFMVIRMVSLWILLITAPLAWVSMIAPGLPGLSNIVGDWWRNFFKWTFFAPIYAFFIYLAVLAAAPGANGTSAIFQNVQTAAQKQVTQGIFTNSFLSGGLFMLLQYLVIIMLLLAGLKTAQSSGLLGANAVMAWGKKAGNKIKDYAKRPAGAVYDKYANKAVQWTGDKINEYTPFARYGRRLKAKGVAMETSAENKEQHKAYANLTKTMSDQDLGKEVQNAYGIRKLIAARQAKERGLLDRTDDVATVKKAMDTFGAYGLKDNEGKTKERKDLEDVRFDALGLDYNNKDDAKKLESIIIRAKENGNLEKIKEKVAGNENAMNAVANVLKHEFDDMYKKWGKKAKDAAKNALKESFKNDDSWSDAGKQRRQTYASITGEINTAFSLKKDASGNLVDGDNGTELFKKHIQGLTAAKITEIRHKDKEEDLKIIGQYAKPELVEAFARERGASAEQKMFFNAGVEKNPDPKAKEFININPGATQYQPKGINERRRRNRPQQNA